MSSTLNPEPNRSPSRLSSVSVNAGNAIECHADMTLPEMRRKVAQIAEDALLTLACEHTDPKAFMTNGVVVVRIDIEHVANPVAEAL